MADKTKLIFKRVASMPASGLTAGEIYFDKAKRVINVATGSNTYETYGGAIDASLNNGVFTVTKGDGTVITLNFSDVASAEQIGQAFKDIDSSINTLESAVAALSDNQAATIAAAIDSSIKALDSSKTSAAGGNVVVTVEETDGKISTVSVDDTVLAGKISNINELYEAQNGRLTNLETSVGNHETRIDNLEDASAALGRRIDAADASIKKLEDASAALGGRIDGHDNRLTALESSVGDHEDRIDTAESDIAAIKTKNNDQDSSIIDIKSKLNSINVTDGDGITVTKGTSNETYTVALDVSIVYDSAYEVSGNTYHAIKIVDKSTDAVLSWVDAAEFVKDGILSNVSYDTDTNKMTFTFNTDSEKDSIEVDLNDLVDVYTSGNTSQLYLDGNQIKLHTTADTDAAATAIALKGYVDTAISEVNADNTALEGRVDALEASVGDHEDHIDSIETKNTQQDSSISDISTRVAATEARNTVEDASIKKLEDASAALGGRIDSADASIAALKDASAALAGRVSAIESSYVTTVKGASDANNLVTITPAAATNGAVELGVSVSTVGDSGNLTRKQYVDDALQTAKNYADDASQAALDAAKAYTDDALTWATFA